MAVKRWSPRANATPAEVRKLQAADQSKAKPRHARTKYQPAAVAAPLSEPVLGYFVAAALLSGPPMGSSVYKAQAKETVSAYAMPASISSFNWLMHSESRVSS